MTTIDVPLRVSLATQLRQRSFLRVPDPCCKAMQGMSGLCRSMGTKADVCKVSVCHSITKAAMRSKSGVPPKQIEIQLACPLDDGVLLSAAA